MQLVDIIGKALGIRAFYHKVISGNIANAQTPAYREKDIDFRNELHKRVEGTGVSGSGNPHDYTVSEKSAAEGLSSIDGNTVNLEDQMVKLTENQLMYRALVQIAGKRFALMKYLIGEGRR